MRDKIQENVKQFQSLGNLERMRKVLEFQTFLALQSSEIYNSSPERL